MFFPGQTTKKKKLMFPVCLNKAKVTKHTARKKTDVNLKSSLSGIYFVSFVTFEEVTVSLHAKKVPRVLTI